MKKTMKIIMSCLLGLTLIVGCSSDSNNELPKVAVIQLVEHTSLDIIKDAFDDEMKNLGYTDGENITIIFENAQGDNNTAASIIQDFQSKDPDVVMAIATPVAQAAAVMAKDTPVVFAAVSDPIGAKLTSSLENPDKNITGTCDEIQVDLILEKALEVDPDLKTLGVIYNKGEANSVTNIEKAKEYAASKGIKIIEATVTKTNEIQTAIDTLTDSCDAVFAPNDNTVASAMNVVANACVKAKIPLYVGADSMVMDGGFLSVGINYEELGRETARMVDRILKGDDVKDIPVKVYKEDLNVYVNQDVLDQLGITLPESIASDEALQMIK